MPCVRMSVPCLHARPATHTSGHLHTWTAFTTTRSHRLLLPPLQAPCPRAVTWACCRTYRPWWPCCCPAWWTHSPWCASSPAGPCPATATGTSCQTWPRSSTRLSSRRAWTLCWPRCSSACWTTTGRCRSLPAARWPTSRTTQVGCLCCAVLPALARVLMPYCCVSAGAW
jgi:hypothetical protein